jgi:pimeloyl-ACP methyl ester carboxylesterase
MPMWIAKIVAWLIVAAVVVAVLAVGLVYLAPEKVTRWAIDSERKRAGLTRKEIDLPGGLRYVYLEGGRGEPMLLLHGFGANKDNFTRVARHLTPHYRVIVPDHIGFGESAHPADVDYGPAAQAERLRTFAHALGVQRLHLGGNSMGGQIALTFASLHPEEVKSLWLLDAAGVWSAPESELRRVIRETGENPLVARNEKEFRQLVAFVMSDPPYVPGPVIDVIAQERIRNVALEQRIFAQIAADSIEARIKDLATPALIVWGAEDRAVNVATAGVLHKLLPRSQVIVMQGVGHLPMMERPGDTARDYLQFLAAVRD